MINTMAKEIPMAVTCIEAGHCLGLSTGCNLYPVKPGTCRERFKAINFDAIEVNSHEEYQEAQSA